MSNNYKGKHLWATLYNGPPFFLRDFLSAFIRLLPVSDIDGQKKIAFSGRWTFISSHGQINGAFSGRVLFFGVMFLNATILEGGVAKNMANCWSRTVCCFLSVAFRSKQMRVLHYCPAD